MKEVRKLSLDAHAAAKDVKSDVAKFAAHAAGQAVANKDGMLNKLPAEAGQAVTIFALLRESVPG
jgi:non-ribosomal peptide synthetase component E (peptide arylation enzyme)